MRRLQNAPKDSEAEHIASIISRSLGSLTIEEKEAVDRIPPPYNENLPHGRYDFDLAEFPVFKLCKAKTLIQTKEPLIYQDTISGKDGETITRVWKTFAQSEHGFGGSSAQVLLYDLLQLYVEQGCEGNYIRFGTLRSLFLRHGDRNPSQRDYERMRRDLDILCGYWFKCENAFWDAERKSYVDMNWRLFNNVFYFKEKPNSLQEEMPFGFIEINSVLQAIARSRGFFAIGFPSELFYQLKPLEQRLALYLAKRFKSEKMHIRFVDTLAKALPIEATRTADVRTTLKAASQGLLEKKLPILSSFSVEKTRRGEWVAVFHRKEAPKDNPPRFEPKESLPPDIDALVQKLIEASDQPEDWRWWLQCARSLGRDGIFRAVGQFEEKRRLENVHRPGALLTAIIKDIAQQMKLTIH